MDQGEEAEGALLALPCAAPVLQRRAEAPVCSGQGADLIISIEWLVLPQPRTPMMP